MVADGWEAWVVDEWDDTAEALWWLAYGYYSPPDRKPPEARRLARLALADWLEDHGAHPAEVGRHRRDAEEFGPV